MVIRQVVPAARSDGVNDLTVNIDAFDEVILYQDQCQRGRADGEVLALLRDGLKNARRTSASQEIDGEFIAIDTALSTLGEGDLCLILVDQVEEALEHIARRIAEG